MAILSLSAASFRVITDINKIVNVILAEIGHVVGGLAARCVRNVSKSLVLSFDESSFLNPTYFKRLTVH